MTTKATSAHTGQLYPKKYFDQSPTWSVWNQLTAKDVFDLREEPGFAGQDVYFILNHPIRYAYLCGLVVDFALAPGNGALRYAILELDDGSGRTIEIKIPREQVDFYGQLRDTPNTLIESVKVEVNLGIASLSVDERPVPIGSIVRVKGTITKFRERQIELKRLFLVESTDEEVRFWARLAKHRRDVLSQPWIFTAKERAKTEEKAERKARSVRRAAAKRLLREARSKVEQAELDKKLAAIFDVGALPGSEIIRAPWEQQIMRPGK